LNLDELNTRDELRTTRCVADQIEDVLAIDFAHGAGMKDVFAHGMLSMAYLGRALTEWVPQRQILSYGVRFAALTHLGDRVRCSGKVVEKLEHAGRPCVRVQISATKATGEITLAGEALVALN